MKNDFDIIFYGGTFDPIHKGHLNVLNRVLEIFKESKIIIAPCKNPVHKDNNYVLDISHRMNMVKLATKGISRVFVSDIDLKSELNYTIDTLNSLSFKFKNKKISVLLGSDSFLSIEAWKNYLDILQFYDLIVYVREYSHKILVNKKSKFLNIKPFIIDDLVLDVSSTFIKDNILLSVKSNNFLDSDVISYIKDNKLYNFKG